MKKLCLYTISILFFVSCNNIDEFDATNNVPNNSSKVILTAEEYASIAYDNLSELSDNEAITIAEEFNNKNNTKTSKNNSLSVSISKKYFLNSNREKLGSRLTKSSLQKNPSRSDVPIFEVNLNDDTEGIAYISGDTRFSGVIAYIPKTVNNNDLEKTGRELLLDISMNTVLDQIEYVEKLRDSLKIQTLEKVCKKLNLKSEDIEFSRIKDQIVIEEKINTKSSPTDWPNGKIDIVEGNFAWVEWDQLYPYNKQLPPNPNFPALPRVRYPAGCGVIATALVLTAVQPNMTINNKKINWNYITTDENILEYPDVRWNGLSDPADKIDMVSNLISHIYYGTETTTTIGVNNRYGSSDTYNNKMYDYLIKYINIDYLDFFNVEKIKNSILKSYPVVMGGRHDVGTINEGSHGWVIDGLIMTIEGTGSVRQYNLYLHANMGWSGTDNGYYLVSKSNTLTFDTGVGSYNSNLWQMCNARKK